MTNRSTNEELQEKYEFAAQLIGEGHSKSQIVKTLVEKYDVTPQQARTYKREGSKIFRETIYEPKAGAGKKDTTVADAIELEFFVIGDNLKEDRIRAAEDGNWTAVASINKTRLKHLDMARVIDPGSFWAKDEENYQMAVAKENVEENFPSKSLKGYISGQWESNKFPKPTEKEEKEWEKMAKEKNLDITGEVLKEGRRVWPKDCPF